MVVVVVVVVVVYECSAVPVRTGPGYDLSQSQKCSKSTEDYISFDPTSLIQLSRANIVQLQYVYGSEWMWIREKAWGVLKTFII